MFLHRLIQLLLLACLLGLFCTLAFASDEAGGAENASNPLAKVKNTDLRWQYLDRDNGHINDLFVDGAFMATDSLKVKYELHYWETNPTGSSEKDFESFVLKGIYFPTEGMWGATPFRVAVGLDWIVDLGDQDKGIGSGSDQIAPFGGVAFGLGNGTMLIPLVQQFLSYSGKDVNTTAFRVIALKPFPEQMWLKLDAKLPIDWEHNRAIPASAEVQVGKTLTPLVGLYVDGLVGIGKDRPYDWGLGVGVRFTY